MNAVLLEQITRARRRGVPLIGISTPDQPAIVAEFPKKDCPVIGWDVARGLYGLNDKGADAMTTMEGGEKLKMPGPAMMALAKLAPDTVVLAQNLGRHLADAVVAQAVVNLRDPFKGSGRCLVILGPDVVLPQELRHDVIVLEDPLPDDEGYKSVIEATHKGVTPPLPMPEDVSGHVAALRGLSAFESEQVAAMALDAKGMPSSRLWEHTARAVSKISGLTMSLDGPPLEDVKGMDYLVETYRALFSGPRRPRLVMLLDEVEKALAGLGVRGGAGDNTGVAQDALSQLLVALEEKGWGAASCILLGVPGSGKTVFAKSLGTAYGVPMIRADLGAMTGSLKGQSEAKIREAMRAVASVGGDRVAVIATCNKLEVLPPEFKRRFRLQTWYSDVAGREEKDQLWKVYLPKYGFTVKDQPKDDDGFTGANIRDACELAYSLGRSPAEAAERIIPVVKADPDVVNQLREFASGRFLDVSKPGRYQTPGKFAPAQRKVAV